MVCPNIQFVPNTIRSNVFFFFGVTSSEEFEKLGRLSVSLYGVTVALRNRDFQ